MAAWQSATCLLQELQLLQPQQAARDLTLLPGPLTPEQLQEQQLHAQQPAWLHTLLAQQQQQGTAAAANSAPQRSVVSDGAAAAMCS